MESREDTKDTKGEGKKRSESETEVQGTFRE